jgi:uncharacterized spore protein YtfJ
MLVDGYLEDSDVSDASVLQKGGPVRALTGASSADPGALVKSTVDQLGQVLDARSVVGEPMIFGDITIIPLVSVGFGFGAGGGGGEGVDPRGKPGMGGGGGGAGGGGIKPVAVIIVDKNGARLERIPERPGGFERLGTAFASLFEKRSESKAEKG